jgi:hypothetical protein
MAEYSNEMLRKLQDIQKRKLSRRLRRAKLLILDKSTDRKTKLSPAFKKASKLSENTNAKLRNIQHLEGSKSWYAAARSVVVETRHFYLSKHDSCGCETTPRKIDCSE